MYEELKALSIKILLPAMVAISMKLAILGQYKELTKLKVLVSFVTGLGAAYLLHYPVEVAVAKDWQSVTYGIIAISGEKMSIYAMYKINVEKIIELLRNIKK